MQVVDEDDVLCHSEQEVGADECRSRQYMTPSSCPSRVLTMKMDAINDAGKSPPAVVGKNIAFSIIIQHDYWIDVPFHSIEIVAFFSLHIHFMKNNTIAVNCTTDKPREAMELEVIVTNNSGNKTKKGILMIENSRYSLNDLTFTDMIAGEEYMYSVKIVRSTNKHCSIWIGTFTYQGQCYY